MSPAARRADSRADFDFIFGWWPVRNRKLADVADPDSARRQYNKVYGSIAGVGLVRVVAARVAAADAALGIVDRYQGSQVRLEV
jgi:hypothetical protein